ncbi:hypothetical protein MycrhDRAFT_5571 [Mycolicibacterium rhodesiae JS60]|nr:hypothetical protein MycrhDRAFT_5571 [Mycolicibacterium rhodesiae JS60]
MEKNASAVVDRLTADGFTNSGQIAAYIGAKGLWHGGLGPRLPFGPLIVITFELSRPAWAVDDANEAMSRMCAATVDASKQETLDWEIRGPTPPKQRRFGMQRTVPTPTLERGTLSGWVFPYTDHDKKPSSRVVVVSASGDSIDVGAPSPQPTQGRRTLSRVQYASGDEAKPFRDFGRPSVGYANGEIVARGSCTLLAVPKAWSR